MSNPNDLFPTLSTASETSPVENIVDVLDLREEFDNLVLGSFGEDAIGQKFILRRMRRDSSDNLVPCWCVDELSHEGTRDYPCNSCRGSSNLWDEELVVGYKVVASAPGGSNAASNFPKAEPGTLYVPAARFFLSYNVAPRKDDRILEIELDSSGAAVLPYNRIATYEFMLVRAMRSEGGKIDYWVCSGQKMGPNTQGEVS